jgi:hypothetical protein
MKLIRNFAFGTSKDEVREVREVKEVREEI